MSLPSEQLQVECVTRVQAMPAMLDMVCQSTGMQLAVVTRLIDGQWVVCSIQDDLNIGLLSSSKLALETTCCERASELNQNVIIDRVDKIVHHDRHPILAQYGFQSFISVPVRLHDGSLFGTLCAFDAEPRPVSKPETVQMFTLFAQLTGKQLDTVGAIQSTDEKWCGEEDLSALREQFIAVLGHDLRTPLSSLSCGIELLGMAELDSDSADTLDIMRRSSIHMAGLIDDLMDFARGHLGEGIELDYQADVSASDLLEHSVAELQHLHPTRIINAFIDVSSLMDCDERRLVQVVSNLLRNALIHGSQQSEVQLNAVEEDEFLKLEVINEGKPISKAARYDLFRPYTRLGVRRTRQGLGLGLYIAHCIVSGHGGTIQVKSDNDDTCFTVRIPLHQ